VEEIKMKRVLIFAIAAAFIFGLSAAAHAAVMLGEQKGTDNGGDKAENTFKWSHAPKYSGEHEAEPFKFNYSFGSSQDNQGGQKSQNGQEDASKWSYSHAFKGTLEDPFQFSFGSSQGNQSGQKSQNGQGDASKWSHSHAFKGTLEDPFQFSFGSSQGNQSGQKSQNGQEDASKWSYSHAFKGTLEDPFQFSFGSSQDNQGGNQSDNGLLNAFEWYHSFALSGDQQEDPFMFNYNYGLSRDIDGGYKSMNGPEYAQWQGDVLETAQHFYHYESYGPGDEPATGYIPPNNSQPAPEPVTILLMGLGGAWMVSRRKA
jgi:hypothetical protein